MNPSTALLSDVKRVSLSKPSEEKLEKALSADVEDVPAKATVAPTEQAKGVVKGEATLFDIPPVGDSREKYTEHLKGLGLSIEADGGWKIWRAGKWERIPKLSEWIKEGGEDEG